MGCAGVVDEKIDVRRLHLLERRPHLLDKGVQLAGVADIEPERQGASAHLGDRLDDVVCRLAAAVEGEEAVRRPDAPNFRRCCGRGHGCRRSPAQSCRRLGAELPRSSFSPGSVSPEVTSCGREDNKLISTSAARWPC